MMSVNELEEILPYVSENLFSWSGLLDFRLSGLTGGAFSVHQAIYDFLRENGLSARRNQAIRKSFDEVWKIIGSRYKVPKPLVKSPAPPTRDNISRAKVADFRPI